MSQLQSEGNPLRKVRLLSVVFLIYAIALPTITLLIPESDLPTITSPSLLSWVMILLMPFEMILIYMFYRIFVSKPKFTSIIGPGVLLYMVATIPSIYAMIIGFTDVYMRLIAIPLGLMFSLVGLWLASIFIPKIWDASQSEVP
ncbi:MAG: hypothetical protein ACFE7R_05005 [Candidatus Hodarchaeota archaeon]